MPGPPRLSAAYKHPVSKLPKPPADDPESGLIPIERAFVDAYCNEGRYKVGRAAELVNLSESEAFKLFKDRRIRKAIDGKLSGRIMGRKAIETELSDIAGAEWRDLIDVRYGKDGDVVSASLNLRDKVKALEVLGKLRGYGRDPVMVLLERLMMRDLKGKGPNRQPQPERDQEPEQIGGDEPALLVEGVVLKVEDALSASSELAEHAKVALPPVVEDEQGKALAKSKL